MPKVSIIIPTHNRHAFLKRALESLIKQSHKEWEAIIVDDGDDLAEKVVSDLGDARLKYIKSLTPHRGGAVARNIGIKNASGKYVAFLDDDDEWLTEKLEKQTQILEKWKEAGVCFSRVEALDQAGQRLYISRLPEAGLTKPYENLLKKAFIWTSSIMVRKEILDQGIIFDEELTKNQEWDLTLRLSQTTKFYAIDEPLVRLHIHDSQMGSAANFKARISGHKLFIKKHISAYRKHKRFLAQRYYEIGIIYLDGSKTWKSFLYFLLAFITYPRPLFIRSSLSLMRRAYEKRRNNSLVKKLTLPFRKVYRSGFFSSRRDRKRAYQSAEKMLKFLDIDPVPLMENIEKKEFLHKKFSYGHAGDFEVIILYSLVRTYKPQVVIETGVASGRSSWAILEALHENDFGKLYSIDLPQFYKGKKPERFMTEDRKYEFKGFVPQGNTPGWLVPNSLRDKWELTLGKSSDHLPAILRKLGNIDIFYHDSDHSYENMMFEFNEAWPKIRRGGFLLSDDIKWNRSFDDFVSRVNPHICARAEGFGLILKD